MSEGYLNRWLEEAPMSLEAQRLRAGSREVDPTRSLQEAFDKMPDHVKQQVGAAIVEDAEVTVSAKSDGTVDVHRSGRATLRPFDSNLELINKRIAEQAEILAKAEPGTEAYSKAERAFNQLMESGRYQQAQLAAKGERVAAEHDANLAEMQSTADLIDERQGQLTINARRARYGLAPVGE